MLKVSEPMTSKRLSMLAVGVLSLASASQLLAAVGRTPGVLEVSSTGAATYTIPLWMPPGPNGMQPNLALTYNSGSDNGVLGVGWSLSGLSSIERCRHSRGQDARTGGVNLRSDDKFCLDGNRLRLTSGTYGVAGSTYQTEKETFAIITASETVGEGPRYFIVQGNDARRYEYGVTDDSRVFAGTAPSALRWMLNKVTDRAGNSYVISYSKTSGYAVPTTISWTPTGAGQSTYRYTATFTYSTKTEKDSISGFVAQQPIISNQRLESIEIASSSTVVRKYAFTYDTGTISQRSRLTEIKECSDAAATNCLAPTVVAYQAGTLGVTSSAGTVVSASSRTSSEPNDLNGDGRHDLLFVTGSTWHVAFAASTGFTAPVNTGIDQWTPVRALRYAANGQDGLLVAIAGTWWYYAWNGSSFAAVSTSAPAPGNMYSYKSLDIDGDGLVDLAWVDGNSVYTRLNTTPAGASVPSFSSTAQLGATVTSIGNLEGFVEGTNRDLDGDGNHDLMLIRSRQPPKTEEPIYYAIPLYSRGATFEVGAEIYLGLMSSGFALGLFDFNDDACADWFAETLIHISRCANTAASNVALPPGIVSILDWDSDGRDDLLFNNGGNIGVYRSTGSALAPATATSVPYTGGGYFAMDADGDGLDDIFVTSPTAPHPVSYYKRPEIVEGDAVITTIPDLATSFSDGYGVTFAPKYTTTARSSYTPGANTEYPLRNVATTMIVNRVTQSNGVGGTFDTFYSYAGARQDVSRGEFLGFEQRTKIDSRNNLRMRTTYEQGFPKTGLVKKEELLHADGVTLISETTNEYSVHHYEPVARENRWLPYLSRSTTKKYDLTSGQLISTTTTTNTVDENSGGTTDSVTEVVEAATANGAQAYSYTSSIHNTLFNASGCYGRPETTTTTNSNTIPNQVSLVRTTRTNWSSTHCRPTQVTIQPGDPKWQVTTDLLYDDFGNVNHITETPAANQGQTARVTQINWGTTGQFPNVITNAKNQSTTIGWNDSLGVRTSVQLPNGATTTWTPDEFGRVAAETRPDNTRSTFTLTSCSSADSYCSGLPDFRYKLDVRTFDSNDHTTARRLDTQYFDAFDRIRYSDVEMLAATSRTITSYDALGRVASRSVPHAPGAAAIASSHFYDLLNRETLVQRQASATDTTTISTTTTYSGLRRVVTDPMGKPQTFVHDALGRIVQSIDALNSRTEYEYDAFGNLLKTIAAAQDPVLRNEVVLTYNARGFKETSNDPDMGAWEYDYYPFGELKWQRDAKNQETTFHYDELSRPTARIEAEGTTNFGYDDPLVNGEGQLTSVTGPGAYSETYAYDDIGRLSNRNITIGAESFDYDYTYAVNGALERLTYPNTTGSRLAIDYSYQKGLLTGVSKVGATTYWGSPKLNARGQMTEVTLGNGVVRQAIIDAITGLPDHIRSGLSGGYGLQNESYLFDYVGNLEQRQNGNPSLTENFVYDDLHRLDYSLLGGAVNLDMSYDALGNITSRSDVQSGVTWTYHATKKHAVTQAGPNSYSYDANGNAITRNGYEIKWTSYNYPYEINGLGKKLTFDYGPDRQRYRQEYQNGSTTETTLYIGGLLEKVTSGGTTDWRHYIVAEGEIVAVVSRRTSAAETTWYLLKDHLGSIAKILNSSGTEYVSESFAAFGARRDSNDWSGACPCPDLDKIKSVTRRGYTEHEMIGGQSMGLIHMNGRVQDAVLGRFLSADPIVQAPFNLQSLNRYSYVFNNPLSFTDPSGFLCWYSYITEPDGSVMQGERHCDHAEPPMIGERINWVGELGEVGGGSGYRGSTGATPILEEVVATASRDNTCTIWDFIADLDEALTRAVWNSNTLSLAFNVDVTWGWGERYSQYAVAVGFNTSLQGFYQVTKAPNLRGDGAIVSVTGGLNAGWSATAMRTGVEQISVATAHAFVGPYGASASYEQSTSSREVALPDRAARLSFGGGLAAGRAYGQAKEFTGATNPMLGLLREPAEFSGCGGKID